MASLVEGGKKWIGKNGLFVPAFESYLLRKIGGVISVHVFDRVSVYDQGYEGNSILVQIGDARRHKDVVIPPSLLVDDKKLLEVFYEDECPVNYLRVEEGDRLEPRGQQPNGRTQIFTHLVDIVFQRGIFKRETVVPGFVYEAYLNPSTSEFPDGYPGKLTAVTDRCLEGLLVNAFKHEKYK